MIPVVRSKCLFIKFDMKVSGIDLEGKRNNFK